MRFALVSREIAPFVGGGIAPLVTNAATLLSEVGEVTLITSDAHRDSYALARATGDPGLPPDSVRIEFASEPKDGNHGSYLSHMHAWSAAVDASLRDVYGDHGPDLIEFPDYFAEGFVTVQAAHTRARWLENTMVCVRLHTTAHMCSVLDGYVPSDVASQSIFEAERYTLQHADRVLWCGGDIYETYRRFYAPSLIAPAALVPDAFTVDMPADGGSAGGPGTDGPLQLLYLGRLERRKGVQNLLRAVTSLDRDDWHLTLLGGDTTSGPLETSLRSQLELMAAGDPRISFISGVPRDHVTGYLQRAHVVLIPSLWECWPNVGREALLENRPVLATPTGGLLEMVQPGRSGFLTRDTGVEALRDAIEAVLDDRRAVNELLEAGGPRAVFEEITDPQRTVDAYVEVARTGPRRRARRPRREPLVSVIVPYFRLERLVEETLGSVLEQTYDTLEIIVVNDGSLRDEDRLLYDLPAGVRVVTKVNSGLGAARNFGIRASRGRYVLPLDADDLIAPTLIERCVDVLEREPELAYVTPWVEYMEPDGTPISDPSLGYMPFGNWSSLIDQVNVAGTCVALIRRSIFDEGHWYSEDMTSYEDWLLYRELHHAGRHGAAIPERLFRYRVRPDSMMRTTGAPRTARLVGEMDAHMLERTMTWTGVPAKRADEVAL
jgi:glycosyltransferase involved in cell wall biosynthesis